MVNEFMTKDLKIYNGERTVSSINGVSLFNKCCWEFSCHMQNNETGPLFYTSHKNQRKVD